MGIFSGRHFPRDIILWAVRWYCRYGVSYRDLEEMMTERGVPVDHTTIYRWVQKYCQMRVFGTGVLGTRYCRVPGSWYRAEGYVGPGR